MNAKDEVICPWCQTEIVWDPEIGPEDECPHCFNELSDYRSIRLTVKQTGQPLSFGDEAEDEEDLSVAWDESSEPLDSYGETVVHMTDEQDEAPDCSSCNELMLFAGSEVQAPETFVPHAAKTLGMPFLKAPFTLNVFVCPSCFKIEKYLSDSDRVTMVDRIKNEK